MKAEMEGNLRRGARNVGCHRNKVEGKSFAQIPAHLAMSISEGVVFAFACFEVGIMGVLCTLLPARSLLRIPVISVPHMQCNVTILDLQYATFNALAQVLSTSHSSPTSASLRRRSRGWFTRTTICFISRSSRHTCGLMGKLIHGGAFKNFNLRVSCVSSQWASLAIFESSRD